jgi:Mannose-6-phosphate isomerase
VAPQVTEEHVKVHRPWGSYQSVDNGERHQVKRIIVKPGQRLSLQKHYHRPAPVIGPLQEHLRSHGFQFPARNYRDNRTNCRRAQRPKLAPLS